MFSCTHEVPHLIPSLKRQEQVHGTVVLEGARQVLLGEPFRGFAKGHHGSLLISGPTDHRKAAHMRENHGGDQQGAGLQRECSNSRFSFLAVADVDAGEGFIEALPAALGQARARKAACADHRESSAIWRSQQGPRDHRSRLIATQPCGRLARGMRRGSYAISGPSSPRAHISPGKFQSTLSIWDTRHGLLRARLPPAAGH